MTVVTIARKPEEAAVPDGLPRPGAERRSTRARWGEIELYRMGAAVVVVLYHVRQSMQVHTWAPERQGLHPGSDYPYQGVAWFEFAMSNVDVVVDFFFVISGFLLALPWVRSVVNGTAQPSVRAWAIGRAARAIPLYWLLVLVVWSTRNYGFPAEWRDLLEHLTFTQWLDSERIFYTLGPAWSLSVEICLYPLIPLLLVWVAKPIRSVPVRGLRVAFLSLPVLAVAAASVGWKHWVASSAHHNTDDWSYTFGVPAKADTFCIGILVAILFIAVRDRRMPAWCGVLVRLGAAALLYVIAAHRVDLDPTVVTYFHTFAAIPMAMLAAAVVLSRPGRLNRLLNSRAVVAGGALTFALYLGHEPLLAPLEGLGWLSSREDMLLVNWAVTLPVVLLFAWGLHHVVENPAMRLRLLFDERGRSREFYAPLATEEAAAVTEPPVGADARRRRPAPDSDLVPGGRP
jgi:peptidoglycan/LPS O-acetylase OafA/YrhL